MPEQARTSPGDGPDHVARTRDRLVEVMGGTAPAAGGRRRWLGLTVLLAVLGAVEVGVVALLGHRFLPAAAAYALDALGLAVLIVSCAATVSAAGARHRIGVRDARLSLGLLGAIAVPLAAVVEVVALPPLAAVEEDATGPRIDGGTLVLTSATGLPRVRLVLARSLAGRLLLRRCEATEVVVSYQPPPRRPS